MRPLLAVMFVRGARRTTTRPTTTRLDTRRLDLTRLDTARLAATLLAAMLLAGCMFHPGDDATDASDPGAPLPQDPSSDPPGDPPGSPPGTPPGEPPPGNPPAGVKRVFVTRGTYSGALTSYIAASSGLAAADSICDLRAAAAGLGGNWVAWLSSSQQDAIERVTAAGPWQRLDGKVAFTGRAQLYGEPHVALDLDEHGVQADAFGNTQVWTGTKAGGLRHADTCADWTTATGMGHAGRRATTFDWTDEYSAFCEQPMRLICLEN